MTEYDDFVQAVGNSYIGNSSSISNMLGIFGIEYIIVQGDSLHKIPNCTCSMIPFNLTYIRVNLNQSDNIKLIKSYGNSSIYRNSNYVPLVYASNIYNVNNTMGKSTLEVVNNNTFDIQNESVYSPNVDFYNNTNKLIPPNITPFSYPSIHYRQNTPTHTQVSIRNATTPYYLVFRETYDPYWLAFYSNGTAIPQVNGFANAWYINKPGNYTITLYYTPQTIAWVAWAVSFIGLGITGWIGWMGWREGKKYRIKR
jgi:hypothetical protein